MRPQKEVDITLDELHLLTEALLAERDDPYLGRVAENLLNRLLSLWGYWIKRTDDSASFTLRIRRR